MAKIFGTSARAVFSHVINPIARFLLRLGVTPNAVTVAGTVVVVAGALGFGARGHLIAGTVVVTLACLTDALDGTMARMRGDRGRFGALLDSSMDRISDGAVFGAVVYYLAGQGNPYAGVVATLLCLVLGQVVSYVKARAESLGLDADVGFAERLERLLMVGVGGLLGGAGLDWGLPAAMWVLAAVSAVTIWQRLRHAYQSDQPASFPGAPASSPGAPAAGAEPAASMPAAPEGA